MAKPNKIVQSDFATLKEYSVDDYLVEIYTLDEFKTIKATPTKDLFLQPFITFMSGEGVIECNHILITPENAEQVISNIRQAILVIEKIKKIVAEEES